MGSLGEVPEGSVVESTLESSYAQIREEIAMEKEEDRMKPFEFLLGDWKMEYRIPKSRHSEAMTGTGHGTFSRKLSDRYVVFDYSGVLEGGAEGHAHAIFAWDEKIDHYRFWWFESSGSFAQASCNFINDDTLHLNWHDSILIQTFQKTGPDEVVLKMEEPNADGEFYPILEVIFSRI